MTAPGTADPTNEEVQQLEDLSLDLQAAGIHDIALLIRQLAVAHRHRTFQTRLEIYPKIDREFIATSLKALMPDEDSAAPLEGRTWQTPRLRIENLKLKK